MYLTIVYSKGNQNISFRIEYLTITSLISPSHDKYVHVVATTTM